MRRRAQQGLCRWLEEVPAALHTVDSTFPLHETARAHLAVEARTKVGTVIVRCDQAAPC